MDTSPRGSLVDSPIWNSDIWDGHTAHCDSNLNGIIRKDGSFLGLWRKCETDQLRAIPLIPQATYWRSASTYQPSAKPLFLLRGAGSSNIWTTTVGSELTYHAILIVSNRRDVSKGSAVPMDGTPLAWTDDRGGMRQSIVMIEMSRSSRAQLPPQSLSTHERGCM